MSDGRQRLEPIYRPRARVRKEWQKNEVAHRAIMCNSDTDKTKVRKKQKQSKKLTCRKVSAGNRGACTAEKELDLRYKVTRGGET